jgi:hypothetical protein
LSKESNRNRWPELAKVVDQMRQVFGEIKVESIHENGKLVAGKERTGIQIVPERDWEPRRKK